MIAGLAHFAEALFWVALIAWMIVAFISAIDAILDWRSARVVYKHPRVVNLDERRRAQLQALLREEQQSAHADEWQAIGIGVDEAKRDAALHLIMHGERR